jgi:transposase
VSNVLNEEKKKQVIALGQLGWALRRIEEATGVRRETAAGYLKAAGIPVRQPGGWGRRKTQALSKPANEVTTDPAAAKPANGSEVTTDSVDPKPPPNPTTSTSEPYREIIERALSLGRNVMSVWQELVDRHGFTGSYESVKRYARKLRGAQSPEACGIIKTAPGEESQVDYGTGPMVRDTQTGKYRRTRLFVLTLGFSRKCVRLLRFHSSARIWAELHEEAFRRLGGTTRVVVPDNLKEGVLKPDIYDPALNPLYRDVLAHYGAVAMPCRVRHPDRKTYVSYCTSFRLCTGESWLPGPSASVPFNNDALVQWFV